MAKKKNKASSFGVVQCQKLGPGDFEIIDRRDSGSGSEVKLRPLTGGATTWIYEAHIQRGSFSGIRAVGQAKRAEKESQVQKILGKPRQKA